MKQFPIVPVFVVIGFVWLLLVEVLALKHANQGSHRLMRDMHQEMMEDTMDGPRLGKPRPWEPHERTELALMRWSTVAFCALIVAFYVVLQFGSSW